MGLNYLVWRCNVWVGGSPVRQKMALHELIHTLKMFLTLESHTSVGSLKPFFLSIFKSMLKYPLLHSFSLFSHSQILDIFFLNPQQSYIIMPSHRFKIVFKFFSKIHLLKYVLPSFSLIDFSSLFVPLVSWAPSFYLVSCLISHLSFLPSAYYLSSRLPSLPFSSFDLLSPYGKWKVKLAIVLLVFDPVLLITNTSEVLWKGKLQTGQWNGWMDGWMDV